jgi:glycosyltransferase involved in cell wall biosynthesis
MCRRGGAQAGLSVGKPRSSQSGATILKIIHTVHSLRPSAGGPSYSVPALAKALLVTGVRVELWTADPLPPLFPGLAVRHISAGRLTAELLAVCADERSLIIHDHGVWLPWNHSVATAARRAGVPRVVSPRGMLEPWAMQHRRWKKKLAWGLYQRRDLHTAALLHATAAQEAESLRALGLLGPIMIAPNGVELQEEAPAGHRTDLPLHTIFFLSRIHPKKGLLDLVTAWDRIRAPGWQVIVAGPDEEGHLAEVQRAVARAGLSSAFHFAGPLAGDAKMAAYRSADLFVLPSYSENFGLVVAEALSAGLPVVTTQGTPWKELVTEHCGWWVSPGPASLEEALREAMERTPGERRAMGQRGRRLIETRYAWPAIAQQMILEYQPLIR